MWQISYRLFRQTSLVLIVIAIGQLTRAQDIIDAEDSRDVPAGVPVTVTDAQFDRYERFVFGPQGVDGARERLKSTLLWNLGRVDDTYELTAEQKKKLELAGQADIKRFFDGVRLQKGDPVHSRLILGLVQRLEDEEGQAGLPALKPRVIALGNPARLNVQTLPADPFGTGSLFAKVLTTILTPHQLEKAREAERLSFYRIRIRWVIFPLDKELKLTQEQHRRLVDLIANRTPPLERYGELDEVAILLQVSRIPEANLKPIFNDGQWRLLQAHFERANRMEKTLLEKGYLHHGQTKATRPKAGKAEARRPSLGSLPRSIATTESLSLKRNARRQLFRQPRPIYHLPHTIT